MAAPFPHLKNESVTMNLIHWEKPNGRDITTNDHPDNVAYAESLGWKRIECDTEEEKPEPKRRGRPRKTE